MLTYIVTATGGRGFQVSLTGAGNDTHLIGGFCFLDTAEAFVEKMRLIDEGRSYYCVDALIDRNRKLITAAIKARSEFRETAVNADHARAQARRIVEEMVRDKHPKQAEMARRVLHT